uniref:Major facilitator superfamily (MFS) profile domain-containing protein n=1 Tax=Odontella aurita TaxID=265563 RepID=A0A7S4HRG1_9STRA|mmetsp:Transcript_14064/g.41216  ORF Transcript_14064/g.41216 Transcript_14064/m.41216 type:complete len:787 (+) Transcript_14064:379-2739(+)
MAGAAAAAAFGPSFSSGSSTATATATASRHPSASAPPSARAAPEPTPAPFDRQPYRVPADEHLSMSGEESSGGGSSAALKPPTVDRLTEPDLFREPRERSAGSESRSGPDGFGSALGRWLRESAWPGLGLFGESYILFSVGTLRPVWEMLYPDCFAGNDGGGVCTDNLLHSLAYGVVLGVILGMIVIGTLANSLGRRNGSILTAALMAVGSLGMTLVTLIGASTPRSMFRSMSALLFVFGIGVGGEYPLSASTASERGMKELRERMEMEEAREEARAMEIERRRKLAAAQVSPCSSATGGILKSSTYPILYDDDNNDGTQTGIIAKPTRGRTVILVFAMQGVGVFLNALTLTFLLLVTGQFGNHPYYAGDAARDNGDGDDYWEGGTNASSVSGYYDKDILLGIWRVIYAIGAATLTIVLVGRIKFLEESDVWAEDQRTREQQDKEQKMGGGIELAGGKARDRKGDLERGGFVPPRLPEAERDDGNSGPSPTSLDSAALPDAISNLSSASEPSHIDPHFPTLVREAAVLDDRSWRRCASTSSIGRPPSEFRLLLRNYWPRLVGSSLSWLLWDVAFYGNKLFQSSFLLALTGPNTTLLELSGAAALNAFVALLGYFAAAFLVDHPRFGRTGLQSYGFLIVGSLFVLCGFLRESVGSATLVVMYLGTSFFGQCGPNATTFLVPAEIFPTQMRSMCHGIAASAGKLGALLAAVLFNYANDTSLFLLSGYASFAACAITFVTIPETTFLDLYEQDRRWRMIVAGRKADYSGAADRPEFLSYYERRRLGLQY